MAFGTYSHNDGSAALEAKDLLEDVHEMPSIRTEHPYQRDYSARSNAMRESGGWETQVQIDPGPDHRPHNERLTQFLDASHPDHAVAVEHEPNEQMRARWHLLKMQAAREREQTKDVDVAVLSFPTDRAPSLRRTRREPEGPFFNARFPIHIPIYALTYGGEM